MSGFLQVFPGAVLGGVVAGGIRELNDVLFQPTRQLETVIPDCALEENHRDDLMITEHPIEQGATIADHAYKRPAEVTLRWAWSNSSPHSDGTEDYVRTVYDYLQNLQITRVVFNILTGKRIYSNMLLSSLSVQTNATSEYTLMLVAVCKEIIIAQTQATTVAPAPSHLIPASTAPVFDNGTKQPEAQDSGFTPDGFNGFHTGGN